MEEYKVCEVCGGKLTGKQTRFCSRVCMSKEGNNVFQNYKAQRKRAILAKLELVDSIGGKCSNCGYDKNIAVLCFHHRDPSLKKFSLDMRALANRKSEEIIAEVSKCELLCHNCHTELHNPGLDLDDIRKMDLEPKVKPKNKKCEICGVKVYRSTGSMCRKCWSEQVKTNGRKKSLVVWPSKEELLKLLETKSKMQLAKELGCSRRTLTKHIA
jgi:hypothetical protein